MGRLLLAVSSDAPTAAAGVITAVAALLVALYPLYKGWSARRNSVANGETDRALKASGELNDRQAAEIARLEKRVRGLERQVRQHRRDELEDDHDRQ